MQYRQLVKKVQDYSGFSDKESEEALQVVVEILASRLTEGERKDFASQLPEKLKDMALSIRGTEKNSVQDILRQMMELQDISEAHAKKQLFAVWKALKEAISEGEIRHIKTQLPKDAVEMLR